VLGPYLAQGLSLWGFLLSTKARLALVLGSLNVALVRKTKTLVLFLRGRWSHSLETIFRSFTNVTKVAKVFLVLKLIESGNLLSRFTILHFLILAD
jgi:hypothetical protein